METEADFWFEKSEMLLRSRRVANDRFAAEWVCTFAHTGEGTGWKCLLCPV